MNVLFCTPFQKNLGGIGVWAHHIYDYYIRVQSDDCNLDVVYIDINRGLNNKKSILHRLYYGIHDYYMLWKKIEAKIIVGRYDVLHICSSASISLMKDLLFIRTAKQKGLKSVIHFHFGRIPELYKLKNWEWKLICKVIRSADSVIVIDKSSFNTLVKCGFNNVYYLPNPISQNVLKYIPSIAPKRNPRTILFVGQGLATKGVIELVTACKDIPDINLRMLGNFPEPMQKKLRTISDNAEWLNFLGSHGMDRVVAEMMKCDLFVLPTYTEGFPNVILEAMACGCAIITTPVGAIPEMLDIQCVPCGLVVEPRNTEALKKAIECLLDDSNLALELGSRAKIRVIEIFSMNVLWNQLVDIWKS